jgi:hypothetical protein
MGRIQWFGVVFGAFSAFLPLATRANAQDVPTVRVVLHDSTSVAEATLEEARGFAAGVFHAAGIEIDGASEVASCAAGSSARAFCVQVLLRPHHPQFEPGKVRTMGLALAADANRAVVSVYLDAVADVARRYGQPRGKVLGIALAHEIGHALLPPPSHSTSGIMRPSWEGDALRHAINGDIAFTERQASLMRDRLNNRPSIP